jgi:hypothetical protein
MSRCQTDPDLQMLRGRVPPGFEERISAGIIWSMKTGSWMEASLNVNKYKFESHRMKLKVLAAPSSGRVICHSVSRLVGSWPVNSSALLRRAGRGLHISEIAHRLRRSRPIAKTNSTCRKDRSTLNYPYQGMWTFISLQEFLKAELNQFPLIVCLFD